MAITTDFAITEEQRQSYREKGFFVLESVVPEENLQLIRSECDVLIQMQDAEMDRQGTTELNLSRKGSRYFVFLAFKERPALRRFIFSDLMAEICRATVGDDALLFWEQFVVKGTSHAEKSIFSWHQDAGYVDGLPVPHYVNAWIALDDVSEENGTIYLLPYDKAGTRDRVDHKVDAKTGDRVGYFGDEPGTPVIAPAGSIAVFSSTTFHRSGPNLTDRMRRAYALQYACEPVHEADGSIMGVAEPFLKDGVKVV